MASLMMVYMILCYFARIILRFTVNGPFGSDDWVITAGSALAIIHSSFKLVEAHHGLGKRTSDVEQADILDIQMNAYIGDIFYVIALMLSKAAAFMLIARLTRYTRHVNAAYVGVGLTALWGIGLVLALCLRCTLPHPWDQVNLECFQAHTRWMAVEISGIALELLLALLPVYIAWGLHVQLRSKLMLLFAFSFRLPVILVGALRIFYLRRQWTLSDPIFHGADASVCMEVELHYSLMAATIPCLKLFIKAFNTGYLGARETNPGAMLGNTSRSGSYRHSTMSGARYKTPSVNDGVPHRASRNTITIFETETVVYTLSTTTVPMTQSITLIRRPAAVSSLSNPLSTRAISSALIRTCASPQSQRPLRAHQQSRHCRYSHSQTCARRLRLSANSSPLLSRTYHSSFHPTPEPPANTYTPEQTAILSAAVDHIPEHGFTTHSLTLGARDAGYLDVSLQLFPNGGEIELITYWLASSRGLLRRKVESGELFGQAGSAEAEKLSVEEKVVMLILERLSMNEGIIQHWQDALATMSLPFNITPSLSELYALSSDILYLAGDSSVDASWYTKRLSVATVYASADVFMTEDTSPDFRATEDFVERQLSDVQSVTDSLGNVKQYLGFVAGSVVGVGRSWGMKV
ncbi:rpsU-divergently transcribed protein [Helicocarpus griseus UAMH5409]|uniref:RpsU-divergently transcribed protein n=1 Tax=Helicocarpus griseus UAMH5409 TaxID=1447875 RepID=A0A2B7Y239_9EURO|nr:rpsU-divergently transcribed protein [Helicocarpus griseus UAMH5409]